MASGGLIGVVVLQSFHTALRGQTPGLQAVALRGGRGGGGQAMEGGSPVRRLVQGQARGRDRVVSTGGAVVLEVRHGPWPLLLLGETLPCLALGEGVEPLCKALLGPHATTITHHPTPM